MQFSLISCHFTFLEAKYYPKHPVLMHPQSTSYPLRDRPTVTYALTRKNRQIMFFFIYCGREG
jgi:hypothetical protein